MTMAALREWPALGGALILPTTLLMLGTVYGQFHYVVDLLAGLAVAAVVIGGWLVTQAVPQGATSTRAQRSGTRSRST
jgi:membrane-associated phospholipid phosphatase